MGAAGGVYPQPPGAYPNPEAPGGTGPGAGNPVDRNGATGAGRLLAIIGLSVSPQPKAILAGASSVRSHTTRLHTTLDLRLPY